MKLSEIKPNPDNPRVIKDAAFEKLCNSINEFPKMMALRPMVVDSENMVLGGNMRLRALQHLGFKEVPDEWVKKASDLTTEEQRRFIIADNVSGGEWDWEALSDWSEPLEDWGLDLPIFDDYSDKNKEVDTDLFDDEIIIKLKYTEQDYTQVMDQLSKIAETPEQAVWKLLGNE